MFLVGNSFIRSSASVNKKPSCRRDRSMLRVIEYFAKSLKVIRNSIIR